MSAESFLSRWAQRKAEAAEAARRASAPPPAEPEPAADAPAQIAEPDITEDEIAALPAVESLISPDQVRQFLRRGVPAALRQAALRRLWTLNPLIRDHVDPALDYAWDFNAPAAGIGWGPMNPGDDAQAMARRILGDAPPPEPREAPADPPDDRIAGEPAPAAAEPVPMAEAPAPEPAAKPEAAPPQPRRHGGAIPV